MLIKMIAVDMLVIKVLRHILALRNDRNLHGAFKINRHLIATHITNRVAALHSLNELVGRRQALLERGLDFLTSSGRDLAERGLLSHHHKGRHAHVDRPSSERVHQ